MRPIRSAATYPYAGTGEVTDFYYAQGVGLVYAKATSIGFSLFEIHIRNWVVN